MRLHYRATNGQAHPHARRLRRVEGLEDLIDALRVNSRSGISDSNQYAILADAGIGLQHAIVDVRSAHRLNRIHNQIEKNLLQLRLISQRFWFYVGKLPLHQNGVFL